MRCIAAFLGWTILCASIVAQDDKSFSSGPKAGSVIPGPFDAFVINGKVAPGRLHCLVCENGLNPVVAVFTREPMEHGVKLYGPFPRAKSLRGAIQILQKIFKFRTCSLDIQEDDPRWRWFRPCLLHAINQCTAPCNLRIDREAYRKDIRRLRLFLDGKKDAVLAEMEAEMREASKALQFEKAARSDLADAEKAEIQVLSAYLPAQMGDADVEKLIQSTISETGASGPKDMGKVMAALKPRLAGKADMGKVSNLVKSKLSG